MVFRLLVTWFLSCAYDVLKGIGVLALVIGDGFAIRPHSHRRARRKGVAFQLFATIFAIGLLLLDDDVGDIEIVLVADDDIRPLRLAPEIDGELESQARNGIAILVDQAIGEKLAHDLFRRKLDILFSDNTLDGIFRAFLLLSLEHTSLKPFYLIARK